MYEVGDLLKFSPFLFKNGNPASPKYFIVLGHIDEKVMMASLPTSKDHVPADAVVEHGWTFQNLKDCLKKAQLLRRKYRNLL